MSINKLKTNIALILFSLKTNKTHLYCPNQPDHGCYIKRSSRNNNRCHINKRNVLEGDKHRKGGLCGVDHIASAHPQFLPNQYNLTSKYKDKPAYIILCYIPFTFRQID